MHRAAPGQQSRPLLAHALAFRVHRIRIQPVRPAAIVLGDVRHCLRLLPVHRARAHQQEAPRPARLGKLHHPFAAAQQHAHQLHRPPCRVQVRRRRAMNHVIEPARRKREVAHIALKERERWLTGEMRHARQKRRRIAAQHCGAHAQPQRAIAVGETLQQPRAKEPRASGKKHAPPPRPLPQRRRVPQNVIEVFSGQGLHAPSINRQRCIVRSHHAIRLSIVAVFYLQ